MVAPGVCEASISRFKSGLPDQCYLTVRNIMKMQQTTEFSFPGSDMSYDEVEQLWKTVEAAGRNCKVVISQSVYSDGPYGSTTTYIEVTKDD